MNAIVGDSYSVPFHLVVDREYVVPTSGSVSYTVYDNAGVPIGGMTDVAVSTGSTTNRVDLNIGSSAHTVAVDKDFEQRTVALKMTVEGQQRTLRRSYYVTSFLNHRVAPEDVLSYLSLLDGELELDQVPIIPAYYLVKEALGATIFDAALVSGTVSQIQVNEIIKLQAAKAFLDTLELRAFKKAGGEGLSFSRFDGIDFAALRSRVISDIKSSTTKLTGESGVPTVFTLSSPTDAITGV
jgi:hypothetical protein